MARAIEIARAEFKSLQEAGSVEGTFKDWYAAKQAASVSTEEVLTTIETAIEATVVAKVKVETKADKARLIFNQEVAKGELVRKTVLARLIDEAGLTKAGANTYFQTMCGKAGLVGSTAKTA